MALFGERYITVHTTMMKYCIPFLLLLAASASGAIVSLNTVADTFVTGGSSDSNAGSPTANYGGAGALEISAPGSPEGEIQSLLRFDLSSAKASFDLTFGAGNWVINGVTLQLGTNFGTQGVQPNNPIFNAINGGKFAIDWMANDNWGEGNGTPASPFIPSNPPVDGATFNSLSGLISGSDRTLGVFTYTPVGNTNPPTVPPATYSLALDPSFVADVSAGDLVSLRGYAADTSVSYLFNARSFGTTANRPTLIISAVPEPGTATLLLCAGIPWLTRRRRYARQA